MKEVQTNRFNEQVEEILGKDFRTKLTFDESGEVIKEAKINIDRPIELPEINHLGHVADSWEFEKATLSRSGAGLRIVFSECTFEPEKVEA